MYWQIYLDPNIFTQLDIYAYLYKCVKLVVHIAKLDFRYYVMQ